MARPIAERLWEKVDLSGGGAACWEWLGAKNPGGYGRIFAEGQGRKLLLAHRVAWELANGPVRDGRSVCHRCDNPGCVNPSHLFLGTHLENMRDRDSKRRRRAPRGELNGRARLTWPQVEEIRNRYRTGGPTQAFLAEEYGVSKAVIYGIIAGRNWKAA